MAPSRNEHADRSVRLSFSGSNARLVPARHHAGTILEINGAEQSHVDLGDPFEIRYEYLRRIANVIDELWADATPITIAHLGAGALTLARYVQATRPGSRQLAVDIEPELMPFILQELPLPAGTLLEAIVGDAREVLGDLGRRGDRFDAIVLDVFSGRETAPHLATHEFYGAALDLLNADGVLAVNVGDDDGQRFLAAQAREINAASVQRGFAEPWILTDTQVARNRALGNAIVVAGPALENMDDSRVKRLFAAGPHPAVVEPWRSVVGN